MKTIDDIVTTAKVSRAVIFKRIARMNLSRTYEHINGRPKRVFTDSEVKLILNEGKEPGRPRKE